MPTRHAGFAEAWSAPKSAPPTRARWPENQRKQDIVIIDTETDEEIVVTVFANRAQQTRIGIKASKRFKILRREVLEREEATDVN